MSIAEGHWGVWAGDGSCVQRHSGNGKEIAEVVEEGLSYNWLPRTDYLHRTSLDFDEEIETWRHEESEPPGNGYNLFDEAETYCEYLILY